MLRSSSCWFEFYSVITQRETDRDRETGGRGGEIRERESGGKRKRREREGRRQERRDTYSYTQRKCLTYTKYNLCDQNVW